MIGVGSTPPHYLSENLQDRRGIVSALHWHIGENIYVGELKEFLTSFSSLHIAAYFGINQIIFEIPSADSGLNSQDSVGRTPLSWAAGNGHEAVVKLLLAKDGVDPDSKDEYGQTPLSWAAGNGHAAVGTLLITKDRIDPYA